MNHRDSFSNTDEEIITSETSVEEIIRALSKRGCTDLTSLIDLDACSQNPYAGGGFCDVYQGKLRDGTRIAIKSLRVYDGPEADSQRKKLLKHAARELYHWSKLQHPNALRLMGLTLFRNHIAMISEWMDNGSLAAFLRLNPAVDRITLCMDICEGLCYIHAHGMIHGDLKAANILVSSHGVAMIADFGNAQLRDLTLKFSNTNGFSVSVRWTAPELLRGEGNSQPTKEADVYACGMTMLEVLTGEVPFAMKKESEVFYSVLLQKRPSRPEAGIEDEMWYLVNSCWAWSPNERPSIGIVNDRLQVLNPGYKDHVQGWSPGSSGISSTQAPDGSLTCTCTRCSTPIEYLASNPSLRPGRALQIRCFKCLAIITDPTGPAQSQVGNGFMPEEGTSGAGFANIEEAFSAVFGGERFIPIIGRISPKTMKGVNDVLNGGYVYTELEESAALVPWDTREWEIISPEERAYREETRTRKEEGDQQVEAQESKAQAARVTELVTELARKLSIYTESTSGRPQEDADVINKWRQICDIEADALRLESFGVELLHTVGFIYVSKAKHYLATNQTFMGMGGWLHNIQGKYHVYSEKASTEQSVLDVKQVFDQIAEAEKAGLSPKEKKKLEDQAAEKGLLALFKRAKLDIESVLRETCDRVLSDPSLHPSKLHHQAEAMRILGEAYLGVKKYDRSEEDYVRIETRASRERAANAGR